MARLELAALCLAAVALTPVSGASAQQRLGDKDQILLANFANESGDERFSDSLPAVLRTALEESPFLSVLPANAVANAAKDLGYSSKLPFTPEVSRSICQRLHGRVYVSGSLRRSGPNFQITLGATDCQSGQEIADAEAWVPDSAEIVDALGRAAAQLRLKFGESAQSVHQFSTPLSQATSGSLDALAAWAEALKVQQESEALAEGSEKALPLLQKAIQVDPKFASAIFRAALIYRDALQEARASEYLIRAFQLPERSSVRERFRNAGLYYSLVTAEPAKAIETYQSWIKAYPRDETPISNLGSFYGDICRYEEAIAQFRRAREMNPSNVIYHENLMEILLAVGRFDEVRQAYDEMRRLKLDDDAAHLYMYVVGFLQNREKEMAEEAAWFSGKASLQHEILSQQADAEAFVGHLTRARELSKQAVDAALRADNKEQAAAWQLNSAWREIVFGDAKEASRQIARALEIAPDSREEGAVAAILLARTGDGTRAQAIAQDLGKRYATHEVVQSYWLPCIRAQLDMANNDPAAALKELETARRYDTLFPQVAFYSPMFSLVMRAEALLALGHPEDSTKEWARISEFPGITQLSATAPFAKLQLARALALEVNAGMPEAAAKARREYEAFFSLWKNADPGIPILKQAKAEYAQVH